MNALLFHKCVMRSFTHREGDAGGGSDAGDCRDGGVVQADVVAEERQDDPQGYRRQTENLEGSVPDLD